MYIGRDYDKVKVREVEAGPEDLTISLLPDKNKILYVCTSSTYDGISSTYGYISMDGELRIDWKKFQKDYRGLGLTTEIKNYNSTWSEDYPATSSFLAFTNDTLGVGVHQISARSGEVNGTELSTILTPSSDKVLLLCDHSDFDHFTDEYGYLTESGKLGIKWNSVAKDYKGIAVSDSIIIQYAKRAYFKEEFYDSWLSTEWNFNPTDLLLFDQNST